MQKITHIIGRLAYGGAERMLLDVCRKIDKDKFEVLVIVLQEGNPLQKDFELAGIKLKFFHKKGKMDFTIVSRVAKYLQEQKPDIVHTHLFEADFWGGMMARKAKVPKVVCTKHDLLNEGFWRNFLGHRARRKCDNVIAISNSVQEFLIKKEKVDVEKTTVIYNGIEVNKFYEPEFKLFRSQTLQIGAVGRLSKEKGQKHLIRSCVFIKEMPWQLTLVGDGPMRRELENLSKMLDVSDKVNFTGMVDDVREHLKDFDIFVLPSISEGLSLSILEAGLMGKFVIATRVGGVPEIIENKVNGLLFTPKNIEQLYKHIVWCINNKEKAQTMAKNLQKFVLEKFDINKVIKQYEELYENFID